MTTELINKTFRIASEAQRHQVMVDSIMTPELPSDATTPAHEL